MINYFSRLKDADRRAGSILKMVANIASKELSGGEGLHSSNVLDNLLANPRVSFCVVGGTQVLPDKFATRYESAIIFGKASELTGDEKYSGLTELLKKYSANFMEKGERYINSDIEKTRVFKIEVEALSGKAKI